MHADGKVDFEIGNHEHIVGKEEGHTAALASRASDSHVGSGGAGHSAHLAFDKYVCFSEVRRSDQVGGTYGKGHGHGQGHEQVSLAES